MNVSTSGTPIYRSKIKRSYARELKPFVLAHQQASVGHCQRGRGRHRAGRRVAEPVRKELASATDEIQVLPMCVQLETEAAQMATEEERQEMLSAFGLGEGA